MAKKNVLIVFGTRPEALKLAPVIAAFRRDSRFRVWTCLTGQHREMVDQVLKLFRLRVDFDLDLMTKGQTLSDLTSRLFPKLDPVLSKSRPDLIMVQGDTTTAFAVALKSFYERIPVAHVEAGLRTYNKYHPFPEEINRVLISHLGDFHFAPTLAAQRNLLREGIPVNKVFVTGNTVVDALKEVRCRLASDEIKLPARLPMGKKILLVTAHRRESFGKPMREICEALKELAQTHPNVAIIYPVHLNPNVQKVAHKILHGLSNVYLWKPLSYLEFLMLMEKCYLILTDSGGVQEEAPSFGKPVLIMREVSERNEGIRLGIAKLVGTSKTKIVSEAKRLLDDPQTYRKMVGKKNPYGDGRASERIVRLTAKALKI